MGDRYLISGASLGLIVGLIRGRNSAKAIHELRRIEEEQFVGRTDGTTSVVDDAAKLLEMKHFNAEEDKKGAEPE